LALALALALLAGLALLLTGLLTGLRLLLVLLLFLLIVLRAHILVVRHDWNSSSQGCAHPAQFLNPAPGKPFRRNLPQLLAGSTVAKASLRARNKAPSNLQKMILSDN
jgi:hypothetical protein